MGPVQAEFGGPIFTQSRDCKERLEADRLDHLLGAKRCPPVLPTSFRARPTAWRIFLRQEKPPAEWAPTLRFTVLAELGVIQPHEVAEALVHSLDPEKMPVVCLGHWPKRSETMTWHVHITKIVQCLCDALAPKQGITSIFIQHAAEVDHEPWVKVLGLKLAGKSVIIYRWVRDKFTAVFRAPYRLQRRKLTLVAGRATEKIQNPQRSKLMQAGFSFKYVA